MYSAVDAVLQNGGAQAGNAAAHAAGQNQKVPGGSKLKLSADELARIVAEEKVSKGKLPRYPGLERWRLVEKMGDGAFSNVYRAIDTEGTAGEVAIKVVRKFEMNQNQVSRASKHRLFLDFLFFEPCQRSLLLGGCTSSCRFQEAAQSRGGAHKISLIVTLRRAFSSPTGFCLPCYLQSCADKLLNRERIF